MSQNSSQSSNIRPKLQRQATIIHSEENIHVSTNDQSSSGNYSNMDNSDIKDTSNAVDDIHTQWVSNNSRSDQQFGRPYWSVERAYNRSNPTLRL